MNGWLENFWSKVSKDPDGCWLWTGATYAGKVGDSTRAYGAFGRRVDTSRSYWDTRETAAHRISWVIHFGPIPGMLFVLHTCDTPRCVRPDHLYLGTPQHNMDDRVRRGRNNFLIIPSSPTQQGYFQHD